MRKSRGSVSIQLKIVSLTILILVAGMAIAVSVTVNNQRSNLLQAAQRTLTVNTQLLDATVDNLMLAGDAPVVVRAMTSFKSIQEFLDISIYRPDGTVAFSDMTTIDKVNAYTGTTKFGPTPRLALATLSGPSFDRAVRTMLPVQVELTKERALEYFFPQLPMTRTAEHATATAERCAALRTSRFPVPAFSTRSVPQPVSWGSSSRRSAYPSPGCFSSCSTAPSSPRAGHRAGGAGRRKRRPRRACHRAWP